MRDGLEPPTHCFECSCSTIELCRETYQDVLPQLLNMVLPCQIQHASCLSPCGILNHASGQRPSRTVLPGIARRPWLQTSDLPDYPFPIRIGWIRVLGVDCESTCALTVGLGAILSDQAPSSCLPRLFYHGPFRAGAGLHGWITCVTLVRRVSSFGPVAGLIL